MIYSLNDFYRVLYIFQNEKNLIILVGVFYLMYCYPILLLKKVISKHVNPPSAIYDKNILPNILLFLCQNLIFCLVLIFFFVVKKQICINHLHYLGKKEITQCSSIVNKLGNLCIYEIAQVLL